LFRTPTYNARCKDLKAGEVVPRLLAMIEPLPSDEFQARLGTVRSSTIAQEVHLVDILCPANSGGLKGLIFRVGQVSGLIRALHRIQAEAVKRGLIGKPVGQ
jgi:hypothetical protein